MLTSEVYVSIYQPVRDEMIRLLSVPRLSTYTATCGGDIKAAIALYQWNLEVSSALFTAIHYFEVALRNTVDGRLSKDFGGAESWFDSTAAPLSAGGQRKARQAKGRVEQAGHEITHGRVIAELPLGFWWTLFSESYNRTLWAPSLRHAFPRARRDRMHSEIDKIRLLRNRIAHHEPLIAHDLQVEYTRILQTAEHIDVRLAWWIDATSRVGAALDRRPT